VNDLDGIVSVASMRQTLEVKSDISVRLTCYNPGVTLVQPGFTYSNSAFYLYCVLLIFVWISQQTAVCFPVQH